MAIVDLPPGIVISKPMTCSVCGVLLALSRATAGLYDAAGHQALACVSHFSDVHTLIVGWADFTIRERQRYLEYGQEPHNMQFGRHDAQLDS